jgi:MarR family transcriptional regulator for hemolysin
VPVPEPVGLLIGAARRGFKRAVSERVRSYGLTSLQFWVLVNIDELDGPSLSHLSERLRLDAPTTSRTVQQLIRRKLVKPESDRGDKRRLRLKLTAAARPRLGPLRALAAEMRGAAVHGLSRDEEETLRELLRKIIARLEALPGAA